MTKFNALFSTMFANKSKKVNFLIVLQFVATIIIAVWAALAGKDMDNLARWGMGIAVAAGISPFVDMAFVFISSWQNEKYFSSQTWRLVPISSSKFYLANITSSIVNGLYLVLVQLVMILIASIPVTFFKEFRIGVWEMSRIIGYNWNHHTFWKKIFDAFPIGDVLSLLCGFFFFAVLVYSFVATIDLSSRTLTDFLTDKYSKLVRFVIIVILVIVVAMFASRYLDVASEIEHNLFNSNQNNVVTIWLMNLQLLVLDVIFSVLNIWILGRFHEGK